MRQMKLQLMARKATENDLESKLKEQTTWSNSLETELTSLDKLNHNLEEKIKMLTGKVQAAERSRLEISQKLEQSDNYNQKVEEKYEELKAKLTSIILEFDVGDRRQSFEFHASEFSNTTPTSRASFRLESLSQSLANPHSRISTPSRPFKVKSVSPLFPVNYTLKIINRQWLDQKMEDFVSTYNCDEPLELIFQQYRHMVGGYMEVKFKIEYFAGGRKISNRAQTIGELVGDISGCAIIESRFG